MKTDLEKQILTQLQRGVEITSRPFQPLENVDAVSSPRFQSLEVLKKAQSDGLVRRFGGIFDSRRLGYKSVLCALEVALDEIEEKAAIIRAHSGVTHCYERFPTSQKPNHYPNLWFTFSALLNEFDYELEFLNSELRTTPAAWQARNPVPPKAGSELLQLPALRRFKIDVVFDLSHADHRPVAVEGVVPEVLSPDFSEEEKELVRAIDQQIPLVEEPFAAVAEQIGQSEEWVLSTLRKWKEQGVLRRVGAVLYHRQAGLKANAMCVWPVEPEDLLRAGTCVASRSEVTHCYQRPRFEKFPFDLYAMIHTESLEETEALFSDISESCRLSGGKLFISGREFKKSSMRYFR